MVAASAPWWHPRGPIPATLPSATQWLTVADRPGIFKVILLFNFFVSSSAACIKNPAAERGVACQCLTSVPTGKIASLPLRGLSNNTREKAGSS